MPSFGTASKVLLRTCHPKLQDLFNQVIMGFDCTVIEGERSILRQRELVARGASKTLQSKHCHSPSLAADVAPWVPGRGIPWPHRNTTQYTKDLNLFYYFSGYVMATAKSMGIEVRWGGDWDRDHDLADQKFDDLVHFELVFDQ